MNNLKRKLVIVGPLPDKSGINLGGVSEFTLNLANAMSQYFETTVLTNTSNIREDIHRFSTISVNVNKKVSLVALIKIYFKLLTIKPDIIISELQYSFPSAYIKNCYKIHYIHGFTNLQDYSFSKRIIWKLLNLSVNKKFNLIVANSNFTKIINERFLGVRVDNVFPLAVNDVYLSNFKENSKRDIDIIFVGRMIKTKGIFNILKSLKYLPIGTKIVFVGEGKDYAHLKNLAVARNNVIFLNNKTPDELRRLYNNSKIFISLNNAEPFGLTYIEALACGCEIICPDTGGQVENLLRFSTRVKFISDNDPKTIARAVVDLKSKGNFSEEDLNFIKYFYSYKRLSEDVMNKIPN